MSGILHTCMVSGAAVADRSLNCVVHHIITTLASSPVRRLPMTPSSFCFLQVLSKAVDMVCHHCFYCCHNRHFCNFLLLFICGRLAFKLVPLLFFTIFSGGMEKALAVVMPGRGPASNLLLWTTSLNPAASMSSWV